MLLGGQAGHRLKPVCVVGRPTLLRPRAHGVGHRLGGGLVQGNTLIDRLA